MTAQLVTSCACMCHSRGVHHILDGDQVDCPCAYDLPVELKIDVVGEPVPQGSKSARVQGRRAVLYDDNAKVLTPWRDKIVVAARARARNTGWVRLDGPIEVVIVFFMARPASAANREWPHVRPDSDKLTRAVFDSLTMAEVIADDARIVHHDVWKRYAAKTAGCRITIRPMPA